MDLSRLLEMLLVILTFAVVLSVWIDVGGCVYPIYSTAWSAMMASLQLMNSAPISASAADGMTALMILAIVNNYTLLGGNYVLLDINKCPPDLLLDVVS